MIETTNTIPYGPLLGKIIHVENDVFDGYESTGAADDPELPFYSFRTNFNKDLLAKYIEAFAEVGWTAQQVAIGEEATGFDDEECYSFPVPECYALYLARYNISKESMEKFNSLIDEMYNERLFGIFKSKT